MEKKIVCKLDGRRFATQAALIQHRRDAHPGASKPKPACKPPGGSSRGRRRTGRDRALANMVPVAIPQRIVGTAGSDMAVLSGTDRLVHIADVSKFNSGAVFFDFLVMPGGFKRLAKVSAAFQFIEYEMLQFEVAPQVTVVTGGGYVAGFLGDPEETLNDINQLTSTRGSITTKWWQSANINASFIKKKYYVGSGPELRECSPGRFGCIVDGASSQAGSVTVFCRWRVRLSGAILEPPPPKQFTIKHDIWIRNGHPGVWAKTGSKGNDADWTSKPAEMLAGVAAGDSFRLSTPIGIIKPNDKVYALHHWLYIKDDNSAYLSVNYPTDWYSANYEVDNLVIYKGELVNKVSVAQVTGEARVESLSDSETRTPNSSDSASLSNLLRELLKLLHNHSVSLRRSLPESVSSLEDPPEVLDFEESFSSMESQP